MVIPCNATGRPEGNLRMQGNGKCTYPRDHPFCATNHSEHAFDRMSEEHIHFGIISFELFCLTYNPHLACLPQGSESESFHLKYHPIASLFSKPSIFVKLYYITKLFVSMPSGYPSQNGQSFFRRTYSYSPNNLSRQGEPKNKVPWKIGMVTPAKMIISFILGVAFAAGHHFYYSRLEGVGKLPKSLAVNGLPTLFIIAKSGNCGSGWDCRFLLGHS